MAFEVNWMVVGRLYCFCDSSRVEYVHQFFEFDWKSRSNASCFKGVLSLGGVTAIAQMFFLPGSWFLDMIRTHTMMENLPTKPSFLASPNSAFMVKENLAYSEKENLFDLIHRLFPPDVLEAMFLSRKCDHFFAELAILDLPSQYEDVELHVAAWGGYEALFDTAYRGSYGLVKCNRCGESKPKTSFEKTWNYKGRRGYCRKCNTKKK